MPRISEANNMTQTSKTLHIEPSIPLSAVRSLSKPQRPKSKSLQPCRCPEEGCGKMFSKRSNLKAHMRVHSGVLPYPCTFPGCTKRFRWKSSLKPHIKVHLATENNLRLPVVSASTHRKLPELKVQIPSQRSRNLIMEPRPAQRGSMINLPPPSFLDQSKAGEKSPTAVMDSSTYLHNAPIQDSSKNQRINHYLNDRSLLRLPPLSNPGNEKFVHNNRQPVVRTLFQDSHEQNNRDVKQEDDVDLSCHSVLSGSESSFSTDVVSFTLDPPAEGPIISGAEVGEDLWRNELNVMDPFLDFSENLEAGKGIELLSACTSDVSNSSDEHLRLSEAQWLMQTNGSSTCNVELAGTMYIA